MNDFKYIGEARAFILKHIAPKHDLGSGLIAEYKYNEADYTHSFLVWGGVGLLLVHLDYVKYEDTPTRNHFEIASVTVFSHNETINGRDIQRNYFNNLGEK